MTINERIKHLRKTVLHLSQKEFAEKIGMKQTSVSTFEKKGATVTEQTRTSICTIFNISKDWLEYGNGEIFDKKINFINLDSILQNKIVSNLELEIIKAYFNIDKGLREKVIQEFLLYLNNNDVYAEAINNLPNETNNIHYTDEKSN